MKILKNIITGTLLVSTIAQASWWGRLPGEDRAAIIIGSVLILNNSFRNSEPRHRDIEHQVKRDYEMEIAHQKHPNMNNLEAAYAVENKVYLDEVKKISEVRNPIKEYLENPSLGKIIFSDEKTAVIELYDGTRLTIERKYLK